MTIKQLREKISRELLFENETIFNVFRWIFMIFQNLYALFFATIILALLFSELEPARNYLYQTIPMIFLSLITSFILYELLNHNYKKNNKLMKKIFKNGWYFKEFEGLFAFDKFIFVQLFVYLFFIYGSKKAGAEVLQIPISVTPEVAFTLAAVSASLIVFVELFKQKARPFIKVLAIQSAILFIFSGIMMMISSENPIVLNMKKMTPLVFFLPAIVGLIIFLVKYRDESKNY